jgi:predicted enzyme related to lactoylglutathione lyase
MFQYDKAFLTIATTNLESLVRFYAKFFQQEADSYIPEIYAEFHLKQLQLGIFVPKVDHRSQFSNTTHNPTSICLEVTSLEETIEHLYSIDYLPRSTSLPITIASHGRETYIYDPDGNRLILHQGKTE